MARRALRALLAVFVLSLLFGTPICALATSCLDTAVECSCCGPDSDSCCCRVEDESDREVPASSVAVGAFDASLLMPSETALVEARTVPAGFDPPGDVSWRPATTTATYLLLGQILC